MRNALEISLKNLKWIRIRNKRMAAALLLLSLVVTLNVFWFLRQPGLTLAGDASCGIQEHTHDDACGIQTCVCTLSEEPHIHDESCYQINWIEEYEEHLLVCEKTEDPHVHSDDCYEMIISQDTEMNLICENQNADHSHEDACYQTVITESREERVLICDLVSEPHQHTESCFVTETVAAHEEQVLICDFSEEVHTHDDTCYEWTLTCELEEHVHSIDCYSDNTADVETMLDWQEMFADYPYTGDLRENLVGIARTQVGYSESTRNFEVGSDGIRRGYTRYGAWYGTPYRDWSAIFVSFCLNYAGADPNEFPGNTGANSMAKLWDSLGKYAEAGTYDPIAGDLVFFTNNTAGIVSEVQSSTIYVIRGDVDNAVRSDAMSLTDASIAGWGTTVVTIADSKEEKPPEESIPPPVKSEVDPLDISNGPVFLIAEGGEPLMRMQGYSLRSPRTVTDLLPYLEANGGSYFFTLFDFNNEKLPTDENGYFIAEANEGYKMTITFNSPEGFHPGTYQYQIPNGLLVDGGEGTFVLTDGTNVGNWMVTDSGLITLVLNEHINSRTDITISATLGIHFPEQEEPIDFDGKIKVIVQKPQQEILPTKVSKWGTQGDPASEKSDPTKIYWTVQITGNRDSQIPGSVLTDQVLDYDWSYEHQYTASDIAGGLSFGASVKDPETGAELYWHKWFVSADDPDLTWDENGWSYKMPEIVTCQLCGDTVTLGNEYWTYYVDYTSTPDAVNIAGGLPYNNRVEIDNQTAEGWAEFTQAEVFGDVEKSGTFVSDASGGKFLWELQVTIPGREDGEKALCDWFINDVMTIREQNGARVAYVPNDIHLATVTANYHGKTINVPRIQDATDDDPYAWMLYWSNDQGGNGFNDLRQIYLLCRCDCTDESCGLGNCWTYGFTADDGSWQASSDYCPCWTETENVTFTFTYQTEDVSVIGAYGGMGYDLQNEVMLAYSGGTPVDNAHAKVPVPSVFEKLLTNDFDGYTAKYKITVNEAKMVLTNGTPLYIRDEMTDTLAYISGSLVISAEDAAGNVTRLRQGADYTVTYDGTGNQTDDLGNEVHVLDIVILHPQPVMYTLDYDTTLIIPEHVSEGIKYSNAATVTLWGESIKDTTTEKVYADINIAAKSYKVEMHKTSAVTGEPLAGATFGLYNEHGGLITTDVTDANGELLFQTHIIDGIILREHVLYYMQELKAPPGYQLDDTKYWFCFCDEHGDFCQICQEILAETEAVRIPFEQIGKVHAANQLIHYDLPATGGPGIYPLMLISLIFIATPLVYGFIRRCKQERRGVG